MSLLITFWPASSELGEKLEVLHHSGAKFELPSDNFFSFGEIIVCLKKEWKIFAHNCANQENNMDQGIAWSTLTGTLML